MMAEERSAAGEEEHAQKEWLRVMDLGGWIESKRC
jgi:hypothetical protein